MSSLFVIKDWLTKNRPVKGSQGDEYVTLNKGDIFKEFKKLSK